MCKQAALRIALLGMFAELLGPALATAAPTKVTTFAPPVLYVREPGVAPMSFGAWTALSAMPALTTLGPYEVGYAGQESGILGASPDAALQIAGVPDGRPPQVNTSSCDSQDTTPGAIVPAGSVAFEGTGVYGVRVYLGTEGGSTTACLAGPGTAMSAGAFTAAPVTAAPVVVGQPMVFRAKQLAGDPFVGVRSTPTPGGDVATRCALNATIKPDGSISGRLTATGTADVGDFDMKRPGAWTCVAQTTAQGTDDQGDPVTHSTPWSAPLHLDVRSDFRLRLGQISRTRSDHPRLRFSAEFPDAAAGGKVSLKLTRIAHCKRLSPSAGTFTGRFNAATATVTLTVPRLHSGPRPQIRYYIGTVSFRGTRFYTKSADPNLLLLQAKSGSGFTFFDGTTNRPCLPRATGS